MRRFWTKATAVQADGAWRVLLDGRPIRTQMGAAQIVPTRAIAEALAAEWAGQAEEIDPASFPLRDMADYAIDMVAADRAGVVEKLLGFVETDTLCYRADPDEPLWKRQQTIWEPVVAAFEAREGVRLERVSGVLHRPQPEATLVTLHNRLGALDPFALAALEVTTSLAASLITGLSALEPGADARALWAAAELEEAWQAELWGNDHEAEARRDKRTADFLRAVDFAAAARAP